MTDAPIVTFGIPLMGRAVARDWERVVHHFNATLGSLYNQTDPNFRIIVACTDRPELRVPVDERLEFIEVPQARWGSYGELNGDAGRKRFRITSRCGELGGGYVMFVDADDLVSRRLVDFARTTDHPFGYLIPRGYMLDADHGFLSPYPFDDTRLRFDDSCGTSTIVRFSAEECPGGPQQSVFFDLMGKGHIEVRRRSSAAGRALMDIPFRAAVYVRNTGDNISNFGPERDIPVLENVRLQATKITEELDREFNLSAAGPDQFSLPSTASKLTQPRRLSILISTYRRPDGLRRLLDALVPQIADHPEREIIVVNDGSPEAEYEQVARDFAGRVTYEKLKRNRGIVEARARSAALARGEFLVFIDDDCVPPTTWLDWIDASLANTPDLDVLAGTTRPLWPERPGFMARLNAHFGFHPRPQRAGDLQLFVTANVAIRRERFLRVGGFDLDSPFPGAGEDTDLAIRLHRSGARIRSDPHCYVEHEVADSLLRQIQRNWRYGFSNTWMARQPGAPAWKPDIRFARRRDHWQNFRRQFGIRRQQAVTFSDKTSVRLFGALCAAIVGAAYFDGRAAAARGRAPRRSRSHSPA